MGIRRLTLVARLALGAGYGYANSGPKPDRIGITPWEQSERDRASDIRIVHDRIGPVACKKWAARPLWQRLIVSDGAWCRDWLAERERTAALLERAN